MSINLKELTSLQDKVLVVLYPVLPSDCVITGGTALTRFYGFSHRFSNDIDLFMYNPEKTIVLEWMKHLKDEGLHVEIINISEKVEKKVFHATIIATESNKCPVKLDIVEDVFSGCWLPLKLKTVDTGIEFRVDSLEAILHKNLYAVYNNRLQNMKPRTKDIIDIFVLFKDRFNLRETRRFYKEARDIVLPFDSVIKSIKETEFDYSEIMDLKKEIPNEITKWKNEVLIDDA